MNGFRNWRVAQKIMTGLGLFALLAVFVAGFGAFELDTMADRSRALVDTRAESMKLAATANENKTRIHQIWYASVIENDAPDFQNMLGEIAAERRELESSLNALRPFMDGEDVARFAQVERALADYVRATDAIPALWRAGRREEAEDIVQHPAREAFATLDEALSAIVHHQDELLEAGAAEADAQSVSAMWTLILVSGLGLALIAGLVVWLVRSQITGPLGAMTGLMARLAKGDNGMEVPNSDRLDEIGDMARAVLVFRDAARAQTTAQAEKARADAEQKLVVDTLAEGLGSLAKGDLTCEIKAQFSGVYEQVKSNFNEAVASLRALIGSVIESSASLRTGAGEIAQASEDLARRTESNAASLEETSAALSQIDERIKASASASTRTVERADQAISTVDGGRSMADEAVQAMGRVSESA
ncbi:MCP four helix bundle domain-containing protein, partial [Sphingosinicella terrae]|uniref:MCP four helix bundle domain-containing protein n=1 Tax=Sphingosinicella terrae TaxID=2172047 RepID=UPI0013B3B1DD